MGEKLIHRSMEVIQSNRSPYFTVTVDTSTSCALQKQNQVRASSLPDKA